MGTQSKKIQEASEEEARRLQAQGQELAAAQQAELQRQADDLAAAQTARVNAQNAAQQLYQQRMNEGYNAFADIIAGQNRQMQQEQAEAQQQIAADKNAARWTGLTELAAGIANLVGVGAGNAVSQQYKTYSQDWMQKADRDIREHRARMDNLRDRQRALQLQLNQLKMGDAGTALQNAQRMADQAVQDRIALGQARANAALAPLQTRQQAEDRAGQTRIQGAQHAATIGLQEQAQYERQREFDAQMRAKGLNPDGTVNEIYMERLAAASIANSKKSGSGSSGNFYDFVIEGKHYRTQMSTETYKSGIPRGREELKKDVLKKAGFDGTWEEFSDLATGTFSDKNAKRLAKRTGTIDQYKEYQQIVQAINGLYGMEDENNDYIRSYVEKNKNDLDNFNAYMVSVAGGGEGYEPYGATPVTPATPQRPQPPAAGHAAADTTDVRRPKNVDKELGWDPSDY